MNEKSKIIFLTPEEMRKKQKDLLPPTPEEIVEINERLGKKVDDLLTDADIENVVSRIENDGNSEVVGKEIHEDTTLTEKGTVIETEPHEKYIVFVVLKDGIVTRWRWSLEKGSSGELKKEEVLIKTPTPPTQ